MTLEELKRIEAAATPGPWRLTEHPPEDYAPSYTIEGNNPGARQAWERTLLDDTKYYPTAPGIEDARLIAAMHAMLPRLIAVAEAAKDVGLECDHPILDEDGDGIWAQQVVIDCGECVSCGLIAALAALEAP